MNGAHRQAGVFALAGPGVCAGEAVGSVWDVAPTLLSAMGHPVPGFMQGRVLGAAGPLVDPGDGVAARWRDSAPTEPQPGDERRLRRRLQALGYL
jgi:arylsulfatase A-like enzyme